MVATDVTVIGAGHNGLVAAFYLARAGLTVRVLEACSEVGGACKTEELVPGYRFSTYANFLWCLRPRVAADMRLPERGLEVGGGVPRTRILEGGRSFVYREDPDGLRGEIGRYSERDADAWPQWQALWADCARLLGPYLLSYPPTMDELFASVRRQGRERLLSTLVDSSLAELADRFFESPEMRGSVEAPHDVGSLYEPGSSLIQGLASAAALYSETGDPPLAGYVRGGMGALSDRMAEAARDEGAELRMDAPVSRIVIGSSGVKGVELASGEQLASELVVSSVDVKRTFATLLANVDAVSGLVARVAALRTDVVPLKLHCALSELPELPSFAGSSVWADGPLVIQLSREHHERAWADARQGRLPAAPYMCLMTPTVHDPSLAPGGHHTLSVWVLYAPTVLAQGTWESRREEAGERLVEQIVEHAPGFRDVLEDWVLLTPWDLERRVGLTGGSHQSCRSRPRADPA